MLTPIDIQNHSLKTAVRGYSKKETDDFLEEILQGYESLYKENRELKDKVTSLSEGVQYYKQMETTLQKALVLAEKTSTETQEAAKSKADAMTNEAQAKADSLLTEVQAKADSLLTEAQTKADSLLTEAQNKAGFILTEAQTKADSLLTEAQTKSDSLLKEAQAETDGIRKEIHAYSDITKAKANRELEETRNHVRKLVQSYETYRLQFKKLAESQIEMLESENYSIFVPELAEMLDDAPDADTAMETQKTIAINLKSTEQIVMETAGTASKTESFSSEAAKNPSIEPLVLAESAAGQESAVNGQTGHAVDTAAGNVHVEEEPSGIRANDIVPGSVTIEEKKTEFHANAINSGSTMMEEKKTEFHANVTNSGSTMMEEKKLEFHTNVMNSGSTIMEEKKPEFHTNAMTSGSVMTEEKKTVMQVNDVDSDDKNIESEEQEIHATDIVPGNPAAFIHETPKIEGYEGAATKTVMPDNNSPFTFIDTE